jgi:hypothetical protein
MATLREIVASYVIEFDKKRELERGNRQIEKGKKSLKGLDNGLKAVTDSMKGFAAAAAAAFIGAGFQNAISNTVEMTNEMARWSQRLGINIVELQGWSRAAQHFGGSMDDITDVLKELQLKARDAMTGATSYVDAFKLVGITTEQLGPVINDQTALMELFTNALNDNTDSATQNFVIDELLSDAGTRLSGMFRAGTPALRRMREEAAQMGGRDMPRLARETERYTQSGRRFNIAIENLRNSIALDLLPILSDLVKRGTQLVGWLKQLRQNTEFVRAAMIAFGVAAGTAAAATIAAWGPAALAIIGIAAAIALVTFGIEDVGRAMQDNGDTVTQARGAADALLFVKSVIEDIRKAVAATAGFFGIDIARIADTDVTGAAAAGRGARAGVGQGLMNFIDGVRENPMVRALTGGESRLNDFGVTAGAPELTEEARIGLAGFRAGTSTVAADAAEFERDFLDDVPLDPEVGSILYQLERNERDRRRQEEITHERQQSFDPRASRAIDRMHVETRDEMLRRNTALAQPAQQSANVNIESPVNINITEAENPAQTRRIVQRELNEHDARQARMLEAALIPEGPVL